MMWHGPFSGAGPTRRQREVSDAATTTANGPEALGAIV
jgi:hypothetical protein